MCVCVCVCVCVVCVCVVCACDTVCVAINIPIILYPKMMAFMNYSKSVSLCGCTFPTIVKFGNPHTKLLFPFSGYWYGKLLQV